MAEIDIMREENIHKEIIKDFTKLEKYENVKKHLSNKYINLRGF